MRMWQEMSISRAILALTLVLIPKSAFGQCGDDYEVGSTRTFTCITDRTCHPQPLVRWTAISNTYLVSHCDSTLDCTGNNEYFTINLREDDEGNYVSTLTVKSLSLTEPFNNEGIWYCESCSTRYLTCEVNPYVRPVNPRCTLRELQAVDGDITGIELSCVMDDVYPSAVCRFQTVTSDGSRQDLPSQPSSADPCSLSLNIEDVGRVGDNNFSAIVLAVGQLETDVAPMTVTPSINLYLPGTTIDCPGYDYKDGYYLGTSVVCSCFLYNKGWPHGEPRWYRDDGVIASDEMSVEYTFTVDLLRQYPNSNYTCVGVSPLGMESPPNSFPLKFAYISSMDLTLEDDGQVVDLCCDSPGFLVQCSFPVSGINPAPRFVFLVDSMPFTTNESSVNIVVDLYQAQAYLNPKVGGVYLIGCRVENSIFTNLTVQMEISKTFYSPPQHAESFDYTEVYDVTLGSQVEATIDIEVTAYPQQITFQFHTGSYNSNITCKNCTVTYRNTSENSGVFEITFRNITQSDLVLYSLTVDNNIGSPLNYSFSLREASSGEDNTWLIVGVVVAAVVIITIIVVVVVWRCRRKEEGAAREPEEPTEASIKGRKKGSVRQSNEDDENIYNEPNEEDEEDYVYCVDSVSAPGGNANPIPGAGKGAKLPKKQLNMPKIIRTTDSAADTSSVPKPSKPKKTTAAADAQKLKDQKAMKSKNGKQKAADDKTSEENSQEKPKPKRGKGKKSANEDPWYVNIPDSKKPEKARTVGNVTEVQAGGGSVEDSGISTSLESVLY